MLLLRPSLLRLRLPLLPPPPQPLFGTYIPRHDDIGVVLFLVVVTSHSSGTTYLYQLPFASGLRLD
jgi:hypothetical protein